MVNAVGAGFELVPKRSQGFSANRQSDFLISLKIGASDYCSVWKSPEANYPNDQRSLTVLNILVGLFVSHQNKSQTWTSRH